MLTFVRFVRYNAALTFVSCATLVIVVAVVNLAVIA